MAWPFVPLGELLTKSDSRIGVSPESTYREVTVRLWGKGVVLRRQVSGTEIAGSSRLAVRAGQFIVSRIDARNGGLIPTELDGALVSNDFPVFSVNTARLIPGFLKWLCKTTAFVGLCKAASEGTTNRVRLKEARFLAAAIPLPPLAEQRRIVARIEALAGRIEEAKNAAADAAQMLDGLLIGAYRKITTGAPLQRLGEIAPLVRRPAAVNPLQDYPQVSVRSFGRGTFRNPPLRGSEITWEKPHLVRAGDVLISNIKAWEGAIAVAGPEDDGRYGSHRYLTYVPTPGAATARFVCYHLLTPEGLHQVGEASPGSADRNRTLSAKALLEMLVPVPPFEQQLWFDELWSKAASVHRLRSESAAELGALLPAVLARAFAGAL